MTQTDIQTYRQTDRQTDIQTDYTHTDRRHDIFCSTPRDRQKSKFLSKSEIKIVSDFLGDYNASLYKDKEAKYTQDDLDKYKEMLIQTNAHHKSYNPDSGLSANSGAKYMQIIKPLFTQTGAGIKIASDNKTEFQYWKDPNSLIDELRLLHYSQEAG